MNTSVLILTLNEEVNLPNCLASLRWCDDIVVLDSFSTDETVSIAKAANARFYQREFDDYARQRNYGINDIQYKNPWLLMVDADEIVPQELADEIDSVINVCDEAMCLFRMRRKDYFMGRWIRHSSGYPTWFGRLMRIGKVCVERPINEEYHTDGKIGFLKEHLIHYPFNKGFHSWLEKHNRYSTMEAEAMMSNKPYKFQPRNIFNSDPIIRRKALKGFANTLPVRPILVFIGLYFLRRGFLDGRAGLTFCLLRTIYEYMIDCNVREIHRRRLGLTL